LYYKKNIDGVDTTYVLNPDIRSVGEMHAILHSVLPSKDMAQSDGWESKQIEKMSALIEASNTNCNN
jgi:hypothetical protein